MTIKMFVIAGMLLSFHAFSSDALFARLPLKANIEGHKFFDFKITRFEFEESEVDVEFSSALGTFKPISTRLFLESSIPSTYEGIGFELEVSEGGSYCSSLYSGELVQTGIASYWLDGVEVNQGESISFEDFRISKDGFFSDVFDFDIKFEKLNETSLQDKNCNGATNIIVGLVF